jgi:hypothetical protein
MRKEFEAEDVELGNLIEQEHVRESVLAEDRKAMGVSRQADERPALVQRPEGKRK